MKKNTLFTAAITGLLGTASSMGMAQGDSWVEKAVHNFGAPINTMWAEGELSFAADGTMVYCSARQDMAVAEGDPKDLYIAYFDEETGTWGNPVNMGIPINQPPRTDVDPLRKGDDREPWITADGNTIYKAAGLRVGLFTAEAEHPARPAPSRGECDQSPDEPCLARHGHVLPCAGLTTTRPWLCACGCRP